MDIMRLKARVTRRLFPLTAIACVLLTTRGTARGESVIDAARTGDVRQLHALLQQHADVNAASGDGMTALHWAAYGDDRDVARLLIEAGANVNARTARGLTPLLLAVDTADGVLVTALLKAGADPNLANALGTTPLMRAAAAGDAESVTALLDRGAEVNAREAAHQHTALMFAAALGRVAVIRVLAARGADLNAFSRTVANTIDLVDEDGNPIPAASRTGGTQRRTKGDGLANGLGGRTALQYTAREGLIAAAAALVEAGAGVNTVDPLDGSSALVVAIANGHYDLAKYLLDHGADPNLPMKDGLAALYATVETQWSPVSWTPTAFTAANGIVQQQTGYLELMTALLARGADANARITKSVWFSPPHHNVSWARAAGATAFWRAAQADDVPAMRLLIAHGADPKIASTDGTTAIAAAAGVGWAGNFSTTAPNAFLPATRYLADEIGLDVNVANTAGYTALMGAAWRGDDELVTYLVSKQATLDARNKRGWSATDMANGPFIRGSEVPVKHPKTIALLKKLGAPDLVSGEDEEVLGGSKSKAAGNRRGPGGRGAATDADDPDAPDADADTPARTQPPPRRKSGDR
jgi:ankyrin repeat protein